MWWIRVEMWWLSMDVWWISKRCIYCIVAEYGLDMLITVEK